MKTQNNIFLAQLEKSELTQLTEEVKETVAICTETEMGMANTKAILSAADLWKIQGMTRPRITRRFLV